MFPLVKILLHLSLNEILEWYNLGEAESSFQPPTHVVIPFTSKGKKLTEVQGHGCYKSETSPE